MTEVIICHKFLTLEEFDLFKSIVGFFFSVVCLNLVLISLLIVWFRSYKNITKLCLVNVFVLVTNKHNLSQCLRCSERDFSLPFKELLYLKLKNATLH